MDASARLLAIVVIASFVTERTLAAAAYLLDTARYLRIRDGAARGLRAKARRRLLMLSLAAIIAYVVVDRADLRILRVLDIGKVHPLTDFWITWLAVFAGADRVRGLLNAGGGSGPAPAKDDPPVLRVQWNDGEIRQVR